MGSRLNLPCYLSNCDYRLSGYSRLSIANTVFLPLQEDEVLNRLLIVFRYQDGCVRYYKGEFPLVPLLKQANR